MARKEGTVEVLKHDINWWLEGTRNVPVELDEASLEFIESSIKQGYVEGELCYTDAKNREFRGWWSISRAEKERCEKLEKALMEIAVAAGVNADHATKDAVGKEQKRQWLWVQKRIQDAMA